MASFRFLSWRISIGISAVSLGFNVLYFYLVRHSLRDALVLGASSLFTIGAMHLGHSLRPASP